MDQHVERAGATLSGHRGSWLAAVVAAAAGAAWLAGGVVVQRQLAARLPPRPANGPPAVRAAIDAADAEARARPGAATIGALGAAYHGAQRPAEAIACYGVAESLDGGGTSWTYLRALLLEERGEAAAAREALEQVAAAAPAHGLAWFRLGEIAFKSGRLDDAQAAYERARAAPAAPAFVPAGGSARQATPLAAYAALGLARVALERGRSDEARAQLRTLTETYPGFGPARSLLRAVDRDGARPPRGFAAPYVPPADPALDAVVAASTHSDVLLKHAGLATRAGDMAWREFLIRRALAANPQDLNVLMEVAALLQAQGRPAEALEYLRQHEALAPGDHHTLVEQGRSLLDLGRLDEAEAVLGRAVVVRDAAAEYNLASALDRQDRWGEARTHYEQALAIDPFHVRAMNNLGVGLDRRGDGARALALFERALDVAPDSPDVLVNYGSALLRAGRHDDAARALRDAVTLAPRDANAHNNLGIALARQGDLPGARDAFARALELDPRHANARGNLDQVTRALAR